MSKRLNLISILTRTLFRFGIMDIFDNVLKEINYIVCSIFLTLILAIKTKQAIIKQNGNRNSFFFKKKVVRSDLALTGT